MSVHVRKSGARFSADRGGKHAIRPSAGIQSEERQEPSSFTITTCSLAVNTERHDGYFVLVFPGRLSTSWHYYVFSVRVISLDAVACTRIYRVTMEHQEIVDLPLQHARCDFHASLVFPSFFLSLFVSFFPLWFFSGDSLFVRSIQNGKCLWNGICFVIFTGDFIRRLNARLTMFEIREVINKIERVELKNWEFDRQKLSEYILISVLIEELK